MLILILALGWHSAFSAPFNPAPSDNPVPAFSDTTFVKATICSGITYTFGTQTLSTSGTYTETFMAANGGDSIVTLKLTVLPVKMSKRNVSLCDGTFYVFKGDTLTVSGTYTDSLKTPAGCDSLVILKLSFVPYFDIQINASICANQTYNFGGLVLDQTGTYIDSLQAIGGCDSTVVLNLVVHPLPEPISLTATICSNEYYLFQGDTLNRTGTYQAILSDVNGCDSTVILELTVLKAPETTVNATICPSAPYQFNGESLSATGTYIGIFQAANGCDSTVTLNLTVLNAPETHLTDAICQGTPYTFNGQSLTQTGMYVATLTAANGCDSLVYLDLTIHPATTANLTATICSNETYSFAGQSLSAPGIYTDSLHSQYGCDSVLVLTLTVLPVQTTSYNASICQGASYPFNGQTLTAAGDYSATLTGSNGCDSTVTVHLVILSTPQTFIDVSICAGETYNYNGTILTDPKAYTFGFTAANGCDSTVILVLTVRPVPVTNLAASVCNGQSYPFAGQTLVQSGVYSDTLTAANGCDSLVVLTLTVHPTDTTHLSASICSNETFTFNGTSLNMAGTYTQSAGNQYGCDSIIILSLKVLPVQVTEINATICDGQSYPFFGDVLTASGNYTAPLTGSNGCDSTVILHLTVLNAPITQIQATICAGETYPYAGQNLDATGIYNYIYPAANGCDSTVSVVLTVLPVPVATHTVSLCQGLTYFFAGQNLSTDGVYTDTLTAANGCDSIDVLNLTFVPGFNTPLTASVCQGETYLFGGVTLSQSGVYADTLSAAGGCDSVVVLTLTVLPKLSTSLQASICASESYPFHGQTLTEPGTYSATLTASTGCDSLITLVLEVLPVKATHQTATICSNASYLFEGQNLTAPGSYTAKLTASNGCDSIVTLVLNVLPVSTTPLSATICANTSYAFNGQALTDPGTYTAVLTAANGCDSIVTLALHVLPVKVENLKATICENSSYTFNNEDLTTAGTYQANLTGYQGCDSLVILELTVLTSPQTQFNATICPGQTYTYNGTPFTQTGAYSFGFTAASGCDSIVTLLLTVLPESGNLIVQTICKGEVYAFGGQQLTESGSYSAVYPSFNGCDSTVTLVLMVDTVQTDVSVQGGTLTAAAANATFQWINCDTNLPVAGATNATFTPTASGNYAVVVSQNGCTATSTCTFVNVVATQEPGDAWQLQLQPNPATGYVLIALDNAPAGTFDFELYDLTGRILLHQPVQLNSGMVRIELNEVPNGILLARISDGRHTTTRRLIKAGE
jgi:hypothetical protein